MLRQIVCFQIPTLHVALARLAEPRLRDRPVAVAPRSPRAVLAEASAEALAEGVYAGMALARARVRCPSLRIISLNAETAHLAQRALRESVRRFAPVWEEPGPGRFYLDLTGTGRIFGRAVDAAARMEKEVAARSGLSGVAGVATNKLVSSIAANAILKPLDLCDVTPGAEKAFLAPRPVAALPSLDRLYGGRTPELLGMLNELDLVTLGKVAGTPLGHLELVLGPRSRLMQQWAAGFDPTPVWPAALRPAREVSHTLDPDEVDDRALLAVLYGLTERICRQLRAAARLSRTVRLALIQTDGREFAGRAPLDRAAQWECEIYPRLEEIFFRLSRRRVRLRKMILRAEGLEEPEKQLALFPESDSGENAKMRRLAAALDAVRSRYGENAVAWGAA
ncbi:MAG TPA: hypothetical protein VGA73_11365 [Candidatus Binatia bacterium]